MLAIDEGIKGYRDDSLEAVKRNQKDENLPLEILSYKELYGWTMDEVVKTIGQSNNCTYCGVLRRQALERGAVKLGCCKVVTGHNADDIAETVLMNMLRGDYNRLGICVNAISGDQDDPLSLPRVKPLKYAYEKEIVLYAYHKKLDYFSTECIYSPFAYRGHVRELIKQMERTRPQSIIDVIYSAECIKINEKKKPINKQKCEKCGFMTSNKVCKACILLEGLNKMKPKNQINFTE